MNRVLQACLKFCQTNDCANKDIMIAYSGGVDSQALLHAFYSLRELGQFTGNLSAIHVNHGISSNATNWQAFTEKQCDELGISYQAITVVLEKKGNIEAEARRARYQAIANIAAKNTIVLTGHHLDDQAETVLLALKRGSGLQGLSAMSGLSNYPFDEKCKGLKVGRPLLSISRDSLQSYIGENKLSWVEDESNVDDKYDRNFFRHQILKPLKDKFPSVLTTIARSADNCQEASELLAEIAEQDFREVSVNDKVLSIDKLASLSMPRRKNLLRFFLSMHVRELPSKAVMMQIENMLNAQLDKQPKVQVHDYWLRRHKSQLYLTPNYTDVSTEKFAISLGSLPANLVLPDALGSYQFSLVKHFDGKGFAISLPKDEDLTVTFSHNNPIVHPHFRDKRRPLKKVLQELDIPSWERKRIPLLFSNETFVAALGYFVDRAYLPQHGESAVKIDGKLVD